MQQKDNSIIEIRHLSKTFKNANGEVHALSDINLRIAPGEIFGIIGMSGAGKSTLVRCINFLEKPTEGTVLLDGRDLSQLTHKELYGARRSMGMIFQQFNLLMQRTTLSNVCFPLEIAGVDKREAKRRAQELLELVGIPEKADAYPSQLSGGQSQRVAIARALATNPKVLLSDEATSALDPATTRDVLALLKDINRRLGITIVVITHQMRVIEEICTHIAVIDESRIAETGRVEEVLTNPRSQAAQRLVYPFAKSPGDFIGTRCCRIVFNGESALEPVIAQMVLEFRETVNILFADTKSIEGKAFGQIIIQLPKSDKTANGMMGYLRARALTVEEVKDYSEYGNR
jgi:D-methionine transport system ATP-binding protein